MKLKLIIQENHPELLLFFAGWGTDETPFLHLKSKSMDVAILYDYTLDRIIGMQPETDTVKEENKKAFSLEALTGRYRTVRLAAWSMGVWSAEYFFNRIVPSFNPVQAVAVNGTLYPIHSSLGIPPAVYDGTMENLPAGLGKFHLRMCGRKEIYEKYKRCIPRRESGGLQIELQALKERISAFPVKLSKAHIRWNTALISENDRIFPTENQQAFWNRYYRQKDSCITSSRCPQQPQNRTHSNISIISGGHFPFFRWAYWENLFAAGTSAGSFVKTATGLHVPPVK